jgi:folate-binding protein YgfZ
MTEMDFDSKMQAAGGIPLEADASVSSTLSYCRPSMAHFGDAAAEYQAAVQSSVIFDVSDRTQIELTGSDRQLFLNNLCSNDVKRLKAGQGCEAFLTNVKGRILAHMMIFVGDASIVIETNPGFEQTLLDHLDRYLIREDVVLAGKSHTLGELFLSGPTAAAVLSSLGIEGAQTLQPSEHTLANAAGIDVSVRRVDWFAVPGYLLATERHHLAALWSEIGRAGPRPAGAMAFHAARIAARFPLHGLDVTEENLAQEANRTPQAISFTKGCYLGQEPIARIDAIGHINRELGTIQFTADLEPAAKDVILSVDGSQVGHITSATPIPGTRDGVALGLLKKGFSKPGTKVRIELRNDSSPAQAIIIDGVVCDRS